MGRVAQNAPILNELRELALPGNLGAPPAAMSTASPTAIPFAPAGPGEKFAWDQRDDGNEHHADQSPRPAAFGFAIAHDSYLTLCSDLSKALPRLCEI
jgi:hypothetical protein